MSDVDVQNHQPVEASPEAGERQMGQPIESRFLFVDVAALRAKQLRRGAKSRLEPASDAEAAAPVAPPVPPAAPGTVAAKKIKAERVAMQEVRQRLVEWQLPDFKAVFDTR
jgi:hypothetical protein